MGLFQRRGGSTVWRRKHCAWWWLIFLALGTVSWAAAQVDDEAALRERASQYWSARVREDGAALYQLLPPSQRDKISQEQYLAREKTTERLRYSAADMGAVAVDKDLGWVQVTVAFQHRDFMAMPPTKQERWTLWERQEGQWYPLSLEQARKFPSRPPQVRLAEEETALTQRAEAFWKAQEARDWPRAYQYLAPAARQQFSEGQFIARNGPMLFVDHYLNWAEVYQPNQGRVNVRYRFKYDDPSLTKMVPREKTGLQDWIKVDGQWFLQLRQVTEDKPGAEASRGESE